MLKLIFPPKCALCMRLLEKDETDLCHSCRTNTEQLRRVKTIIPFVAQWIALWYYKDDVRRSIHRFKFSNRRSYAQVYAKLLAMKLQDTPFTQADMISWVPVSTLRRIKRGYDQSALLAGALSAEMGIPAVPLLKKIRHTPPQSGFRDAAQRRANVLGAYQARTVDALQDKHILLLDDVVTTGATASECAKTLVTAGAQRVSVAAVAAAQYHKK